MTNDLIYYDNIPAQIVPMVLWAIRDHLETAMVNEVPESNPTRAMVVKVGRFIENPLDKNVSVAILGGDFENPAYTDARIDNPDVENFPFRNLPVGEIGGGTYWYRRGVIQFQCFFVRQRFNEELSMQLAYDFYGRLLNAVENTPLPQIRDEYEEGVVPPIVVESSTFFESGGKDKFIWRGKIYWRILTWRP